MSKKRGRTKGSKDFVSLKQRDLRMMVRKKYPELDGYIPVSKKWLEGLGYEVFSGDFECSSEMSVYYSDESGRSEFAEVSELPRLKRRPVKAGRGKQAGERFVAISCRQFKRLLTARESNERILSVAGELSKKETSVKRIRQELAIVFEELDRVKKALSLDDEATLREVRQSLATVANLLKTRYAGMNLKNLNLLLAEVQESPDLLTIPELIETVRARVKLNEVPVKALWWKSLSAGKS